jgi:predicted TIM-barrel fold metal-dependent hydrolase
MSVQANSVVNEAIEPANIALPPGSSSSAALMSSPEGEPSAAWPGVIDAHTHYGGLGDTGIGLGQATTESAAIDADIAKRLATLDARGVAEAVIIGGHGYLRAEGLGDTRRVNDGLAAYRDRAPERIPAAIGIVEPLYGPRGLPELERCKQELGLRGISFHTRFQGVSIDSPWVRRYLERMGELGLVPFVHAVGESASEALWKIDGLAADLPDLPMVVLDAFSTFEQSAFVLRVAERRPNLVFDTALAHGWAFPAQVVAELGSTRVVYGSDLYSASGTVLDMYHVLDALVGSGLPPADIQRMVAGNIRSVLGLAPAEAGSAAASAK